MHIVVALSSVLLLLIFQGPVCAQALDGDSEKVDILLKDFEEALDQNPTGSFGRILKHTSDKHGYGFLHRAGIAYLTGDGVDQNMQRAALLLGSIQLIWPNKKFLTSEQLQGLGHAAYEASMLYVTTDADDDSTLRRRLGYLGLGSNADHQQSLIA